MSSPLVVFCPSVRRSRALRRVLAADDNAVLMTADAEVARAWASDASCVVADGNCAEARAVLAALPNASARIALVDTRDPVAVSELLCDGEGTPHLVHCDPDELIGCDLEEVRVTVAKIVNFDTFGIEKYLAGFGVAIHEISLSSITERAAVLQEMGCYLQDLGESSRQVASILTSADELISNAIYNAPVDELGERRFAALSRRDHKPHLAPHEKIIVRFGAQHGVIAISVADPFGSLDFSRLQNRLERHRDAADPIHYGDGGAGLGLYMVVRSANQTVFNVAHGRCSEIVAIWDPNKRRTGAHSFHFFRDESVVVSERSAGLSWDAPAPMRPTPVTGPIALDDPFGEDIETGLN